MAKTCRSLVIVAPFGGAAGFIAAEWMKLAKRERNLFCTGLLESHFTVIVIPQYKVNGSRLSQLCLSNGLNR